MIDPKKFSWEYYTVLLVAIVALPSDRTCLDIGRRHARGMRSGQLLRERQRQRSSSGLCTIFILVAFRDRVQCIGRVGERRIARCRVRS